MTSFSVELFADGNVKTVLDKAEGFVYEKERYAPYTFLSGVFVTDQPVDARSIREVRFRCGGRYLHYGSADSIICERKNGRNTVRLRSYSFTKLLGQNYAEPGVIVSPDLERLVGGSGISGIAYQSGTDTVNYVYINDKTTIWDAVRIYALKAYRTHPFIYLNNTVMCTPVYRRSHVCSADSIISCGTAQQLGNLISDAYTQDIEGNWSYHLTNSFAQSRLIKKQKYYAMDREWVYDLNDELRYNIFFADRGRQYTFLTYNGYKGEDLCDKETFTPFGGSQQTKEISRITIRGSSKGIFTELAFYSDSYCDLPE